MSDTSFYTDGETYTDALVTVGDSPGSTTPSQAPSSMYPDGSVYDNLSMDLTSNAGTALPLMDATLAAIGVATKWSREDHVHPTDATRAPTANPVFTGSVAVDNGLDGSGIPVFAGYRIRGEDVLTNSAVSNGSGGFLDYTTLVAPAAGGSLCQIQLGNANDASNYYQADVSHLFYTDRWTFLAAQLDSAGLQINSTTASTSTTTGALKVTGGAGIAGALNVGGPVVQGGGSQYLTAFEAVPAVILNQDGAEVGPISAHAYSSTFGNSAWMTFATSRSDTLGAHVAVTPDDTIMYVAAAGSDGTRFSSVSANMYVLVDGAVGDFSVPGRWVFGANAPGDYSPSPCFVIRHDRTEVLQTTSSTNSTTGALTVAGGVGIAGALNVGGVASGPTAAVDTNTPQFATTAYVLAQAGASNPLAAGTAAPGTSTRWSRQDHVHPTDTSRAPIASPNFTGDVGVAGRFINGGTGSTSLGYTQELHTDDTHTLSQQYHAVHVNWGTTTEYPAHRFFKSKSGTKGVHTAVSNNVGLGAIDWGGSDGTSFVIGAGIDGFCDGPVTTGSVPARISFYTTAAGASVLEKMRLDSSGNLGVNGIAASGVRVHAYETTTGSTAQIRAENTSASTGFAEVQAKADAGTNALGIQTNASGGVGYVGGTSSAISLAFYSNSLERMRIASSGGGVSFANGFGYGFYSGVGGTVTQATSKSTGVTLNKVTGTITMNAAALAAGTIVSFAMTNTTIAVGDVLVLNHVSGGTGGAYSLNAQCGAGTATINVRNNTASSLSEAVVLKFVLIKGANS